jgi:dihydropyrimidine dehydrogenase (NAD+) subunit PreT
MNDMGESASFLDRTRLSSVFAEAHPPLDHHQALVEASRCYFCYDAPCVEACPTRIDIPRFIRQISTGNLRGSAHTILAENILGGSCARVCPTEVLCQQACVRNTEDGRPIEIGALQRHATDWLMQHEPTPFTRAARTGRRVAVVGAGPAGLACAHRLAVHGHEIVIFDAKPKPGGLNEYGIAAYKLVDAFAQREVDFIFSVGGITIEHEKSLGRDFDLGRLRRDFDAVFLGLGLAGVRALAAAGEILAGVRDAVDFIAELRQARPEKSPTIGRRVVVIGGGNTAIDAATQSRLLGADEVTIVYRRGPEHMSATVKEQRWAQVNGVVIRHWATPTRLLGSSAVTGVEFELTRCDDAGRLIATGERFVIEADTVLKAIGQTLVPDPLRMPDGMALVVEEGRIRVDADRLTSITGVYAGGDCVAGEDLTVRAVQDGKLAAEAIHRYVTG